MNSERKAHWEKVYETKNPDEVSWTQEVPITSLEMIRSFNLDRSAKIIDIGGGDSKLVDFLLDEGFENITVLDISAKALEKAQKRLGEKAEKVTWIVSDITEFKPDTTYDIWHDRATFHFLTEECQIKKYVEITEHAVSGYLTIGTFSENGPEKCSGLLIKQYSEESLCEVFGKGFETLNCRLENHLTPFGTEQNFVFCSFVRKV
ncbi:SAM-dependent methyltransferase [Flavobacteriaceae bacterium JJC]|nr:SAM-dependent methyltransferase [Flavobacteriaceae bacterium JJC]